MKTFINKENPELIISVPNDCVEKNGDSWLIYPKGLESRLLSNLYWTCIDENESFNKFKENYWNNYSETHEFNEGREILVSLELIKEDYDILVKTFYELGKRQTKKNKEI